MSSEFYYYRPSTPPASFAAVQLDSVHSRTASGSSVHTNDSSPDSVNTNITTPSLSPVIRQHGPTLLPKIRPQDLVVEPFSAGGPQRHRRVLSNSRNPPGFVPYTTSRPSSQRCLASPIDCSLISPISATSMLASRTGSTLSSPVTITPSHSRKPSGCHSRSGSGSSIDEATLSRYGYPTYRQLPKYLTQYSPTTPVSAAAFTYPSYQLVYHPATSQPEVPVFSEPAYAVPESPSAVAVDTIPPMIELTPSTTLLDYLTAPTQAINLVRNVTFTTGRGLHSHFWWDIRNVRSWSTFSLYTINSIPGLTQLLTTQVPQQRTPLANVPSSRLAPDSEAALCDLIRDIYAPRVNAALQISQGSECLSLYPAPDAHLSGNRNNGGPHFLANYATDIERTQSGSPRGRVVGLVKSFDRWNTGMRNEQPHKRVEYLNGLAHLQRCMREHSCRYGFIMTEIELVCVRVGCDAEDVPYFGYLELAAPIATKTSSNSFNAASATIGGDASHNRPSTSSSSDCSSLSRSTSPVRHPSHSSGELSGPLTASLALYYLLMLSKSVPLPSQPSCRLNVGGLDFPSRQRVLGQDKDKWIPEPQVGERRDAKRVRGWVWPQDPWHRREGGGSSRAKASSSARGATKKKWHR